VQLDTESLLPHSAIVETAKHNDTRSAWKLCAGLKDGEIVILDGDYKDLKHLSELSNCGISRVGREKKGLVYDLLDLREVSGDIICNEEIMLKNNTQAGESRRGWRLMETPADDLSDKPSHVVWSAATVCELYKARGKIEIFFKQIKQTLKPGNFLGHSANGIRWQVWAPLAGLRSVTLYQSVQPVDT
jgi:hypothetical protein